MSGLLSGDCIGYIDDFLVPVVAERIYIDKLGSYLLVGGLSLT